jgi:hypothetical protein
MGPAGKRPWQLRRSAGMDTFPRAHPGRTRTVQERDSGKRTSLWIEVAVVGHRRQTPKVFDKSGSSRSFKFRCGFIWYEAIKDIVSPHVSLLFSGLAPKECVSFMSRRRDVARTRGAGGAPLILRRPANGIERARPPSHSLLQYGPRARRSRTAHSSTACMPCTDGRI